MQFQFTPYFLPLIITAVISAGLVLFSWKRKYNQGGTGYSLLMLVITEWLIAYSLGLLSNDVVYRVIMGKIEYLGAVSLPFFWLLFSLKYAKNKRWLMPGRIFILTIIPLALFIAVVSGFEPGLIVDHHNFYNLDSSPLPGFSNIYWFWIHVIYSLAYFFIGTVLVIRHVLVSPNMGLQQSVILHIGVIVPWLGNVTFIFRISPIQAFDLSPLAFILSGLMISWGLFYTRFLDILPVARKTVIERMSDGLIVLNNDNLIVDFNPAVQSLFQMSYNKVINHQFEEIFTEYHELCERVSEAEKRQSELILNVNNEQKHFDLSISLLYNNRGGFKGKLVVFHEITKLKNAELRIRQAKTIAEDADNLKSAFLANMSHEIRTPMNAIIGFSALLNDPAINKSERDEFINHIKNSGNTLLNLIEDIIDISKIDSNQVKLINNNCSLDKLLYELYAKHSDELVRTEKKNVELVLKGQEGRKELIIFSDCTRISQVLSNLINNAIKFTYSGKVEFGYRMRDDKTVLIFVRDTGIGIPSAKQNIIFERFGQVSTSTKREFSGTGLGLAICKNLVKLLGGKIWVDSILGKGSSFYFTLPHAIQEPSELITKPVEASVFVPERPTEPIEEKIVSPEPEPEPAVEIIPEAEPTPEFVPGPEPIPEPIPEPKPEPGPIPEPEPEPEPELVSMPLIEKIPDNDFISEEEIIESVISDEDGYRFKGKHIMVLEHEEMSYLFIELILRKTDCNIVWGKTGRQGISLLENNKNIDLVIIDIQLPDIDGYKTTKLLRDIKPGIPIIAQTAFSGSAENENSIRAGCSASVAKPIKQDDLLSKMYKLLSKK